MSISLAAVYSLLGIGVVFAALAFLMICINVMYRLTAHKAAGVQIEESSAALKTAPGEAPGSAGNVKLYGSDPRDAAMVMAVTAHKLGKPLNRLRFISIKQVED